MGIGTLINNHLPKSEEYHFFTTGYGYQQPPEFHGATVHAIGFRGPMTLKHMKPYLKEDVREIPLIDGAYLTPELIPPCTNVDSNKIGLIPHVDSMAKGRWNEIAEMAGLSLIDPRWRPEVFIEKLTSCSSVLTEAMHGAILADAYRVPWCGYVAHDHINTDKWYDWSESLSIPLELNRVSPVFKGDQGLSLLPKLKNKIKRVAQGVNLFQDDWTHPPSAKSSKSDMKKTSSELKTLASIGQFQLSNYSLVIDKTKHLKERILEFNSARF